MACAAWLGLHSLQLLPSGSWLMEQPLSPVTSLGFSAEGKCSGEYCASNAMFQPGRDTCHFCLSCIRQNQSDGATKPQRVLVCVTLSRVPKTGNFNNVMKRLMGYLTGKMQVAAKSAIQKYPRDSHCV